MLRARYIAPVDPYYYGVGPMETELDSVQLMGLVDDANVYAARNMGRPDGLLTAERPMTDEQLKVLRRDWYASYGGPQNAGKIAILSGAAKWQAVQMAPKDIEWYRADRSSAGGKEAMAHERSR